MVLDDFVLTVLVLSLTCNGISLAESRQPIESKSWSCSFESDLCDWKVETTESSHSGGGPVSDEGWRMFSSQDADALSPALTNPDSFKFIYLQSSRELRSEVRSPGSNTTVLKGKNSAVLLSFSFFSFNGATLSLNLLKSKSHSLAWASTPKENFTPHGENSTSLDEAWVKVAQCIPHGFAANEDTEEEVKIAFVGHLTSNSSIGLRHVRALVLDSDCSPEPVLEDDGTEENKADSVAIEDGVHVAWRFLVILSLFLCFGALFLATLIIVFGGGKNKVTGRTGASSSQQESQSEFRNPSFQFQYRRLEPM